MSVNDDGSSPSPGTMQKKDKQDFYNSREWRALRTWKLRQQPLCEMCQREHGWVVSARCVHHIQPIESTRTKAELWKVGLDASNLMSLCFQCHSDIHKGMNSRSKEGHMQAASNALERWIARQKAALADAKGVPKTTSKP